MCSCSVQPEELTLLLIKLRRQQAELSSLREHTLAQLMALGLEGPNAKVSTPPPSMCVRARACGGDAWATLLQMKVDVMCSVRQGLKHY